MYDVFDIVIIKISINRLRPTLGANVARGRRDIGPESRPRLTTNTTFSSFTQGDHDDYKMVISGRLGRSVSKEQYAFFYRYNALKYLSC
jgi:hypothetical protein